MMVPLLDFFRSTKSEHGIPMERFYKYLGITRQGYLKNKNYKDSQQRMVIALGKQIEKYRKDNDRRAGLRSLYYNLDIKCQYDIGVNKFERLMGDAGYALKPMKVRVVTTQSCVISRRYCNLANGLFINGINQLIVGDITYILIGLKPFYLFLYTDVFSCRIVGWHLDKRMRTIEGLKAMKMFIKLRGKENLKGCIHHTDGGGQYFAKKALNLLEEEVGLRISVAQNCLENGFAEQRNGLLKNHFLPLVTSMKLSKMRVQLEDFIEFYNHKRKQKNLGWKSPVELEKWLTQVEEKPEMILYNREEKQPTKRIGF